MLSSLTLANIVKETLSPAFREIVAKEEVTSRRSAFPLLNAYEAVS